MFKKPISKTKSKVVETNTEWLILRDKNSCQLCNIQNGNKITCYSIIIIKDLHGKKNKVIQNISDLEFYKPW